MTYQPPPGSIPTLEVPDLASVRRVHMIGIGGAGMRNLARLLLARGISVTGSDLKDSHGLGELRSAGASVAVGHRSDQLGDPDAVVVSSAIRRGNPELLEAARREIPIWARAQALAAAAADSSRTVAIAGTHGKTTTTSMIALVLERAGADPTYVVGGEPNESGSGARSGNGDVFVAEADESDGSFLLFRPEIGVVTNIEVDHVDFYAGGRAEIESAFAAFCEHCATVVACADEPGALRAAASSPNTVTYGTSAGADARVRVEGIGPGGARGRLELPDGTVELRLGVDGAHNLLNAAAAVLTTGLLGVPTSVAARALASFTGVHRRFELRGTGRGARFFDDYGHVPSELAVTLDVARRHEPGRLVAVFQPHRYWRTQALWREIGASLAPADLVVVTDVYGAEQDPIPGVTGKLIVDGIGEARPAARIVYLPHRGDVVRFLESEVREGDLVVTMGCGDVWMLADATIARIDGDPAGARIGGGAP
jgi:UDP-N-acetylmuramate--alanine ligase